MRVLLTTLAVPALLAAGQYRAFWADAVHYGYKTPAEIDQMVEDVAQAKANAVFMEVRHRGSSSYLRSLEPPVNWEREYSPSFDALNYLIQKAHARGIEGHAWFPVTSIWGGAAQPTDPRHAYLSHGPNASGAEMWMTVSAANTVSSFYVDPGHPAVLRYLADVIVHVAQNYDVDGLHLAHGRRHPGDPRQPHAGSFLLGPRAGAGGRVADQLPGSAGFPGGAGAGCWGGHVSRGDW